MKNHANCHKSGHHLFSLHVIQEGRWWVCSPVAEAANDEQEEKAAYQAWNTKTSQDSMLLGCY